MLRGGDLRPKPELPDGTPPHRGPVGRGRFCYHQGAIWGGFVTPILTYFAITYGIGPGIPIMVGTCAGSILFSVGLLLGPETKGMVIVGNLDALIHKPDG